MRLSTALPCCVVLALAAFAAARTGAPASASAAGTLEAALGTISTDEIRADLFFVASDEMRGRDTPSEEQRITARYIRARLQRLGIEPGAPNGYFFEYPLSLPRLRPSESFARLSGAASSELQLGRDYWFSARNLRELALEGRVVFCGEGTKSDLDQVDLTGKWALVLERRSTSGELGKSLVEKGALGALLTPDAAYSGKVYAERFAGYGDQLLRGSVQWPSSGADDKPARGSVPYLWLTREAAAQLLPALGDAQAKLPNPGTELEGSFAHTRRLEGEGGIVMAENVCGFLPGSDPLLKNEVLMVSAHYDHTGVNSKGEVFNGADDNGSGTCGVLALAEALVTRGPLRRSVLLMWVSGEEKGLWGSQAWCEHPWLPDGAHAVGDINMDMIGRNAPDSLLVTPTAALPEYNGLVKLAEQFAPLEGFPSLGDADEYWKRSDQFNYSTKLKIPVVFLFADVHEDYHKVTDDPDKVDCDKIRRVTRLVLRMLDGLQADELKL